MKLSITVIALIIVLPITAQAQAPQPTSLAVEFDNTIPQGACYFLIAENGRGMTLDTQYRFNGGPVQTLIGWPKLDNARRGWICTDRTTPVGRYDFVAIRNTLNEEWIPVRATVTVLPMLQPTSLRILYLSTVDQGQCFSLKADNGNYAILDIQYRFNDGPVQTIIGWPRMNNGGLADACTDALTVPGKYEFVAVRSTLRTDWVPVRAIVTVTALPANREVLAAESLSTLMQRAIEAHGLNKVADSFSRGKVTSFAFLGPPQRTSDFTLLTKGTAKVQLAIKQSGTMQYQGSDGARTWNTAVLGSGPAASLVLQSIESHTTRSVRRFLRYQSEGLTLRDLGLKGAARIVEAQDRNGVKTTYYIDPITAIVRRVDFVYGTSRDAFSGSSVADVETDLLYDFGILQGALTPFRIERYLNRVKIEELQFESVQHNLAVPDAAFTPTGPGSQFLP